MSITSKFSSNKIGRAAFSVPKKTEVSVIPDKCCFFGTKREVFTISEISRLIEELSRYSVFFLRRNPILETSGFSIFLAWLHFGLNFVSRKD